MFLPWASGHDGATNTVVATIHPPRGYKQSPTLGNMTEIRKRYRL
jgi:hypothetical protein